MKYLLPIIALFIFSCSQPEQKNNPETQTSADTTQTNPFVAAIEEAHKKDKFIDHADVGFNLVLTFGGSERLNARITLATNSTAVKIEGKDGSVLVYDGDKSYFSGDSAKLNRARFDLFTWSYFFALPYKLSDPGTIWSSFDGIKALDGISYDAMKLDFENNTGDSPDDWYVVYADQETTMLRAAAYIVTLNKSIDEAEKDPHAIVYSDYRNIDGIPIAHNWEFWGWTAEDGLTEKLGSAIISEVGFDDEAEEFYTPPQNSVAIP